MKFEDTIRDIVTTLEEDLMNPINGTAPAGTAPAGTAPAGTSTTGTPTNTTGTSTDPAPAPVASPTTGGGGMLDANKFANLLLNTDIKDPRITAIDQNDPQYLDKLAGVLSQDQSQAQGNGQQPTSVPPAAQNPTGQQVTPAGV